MSALGIFLVCFQSLLYFIHSLRSGLWPAPTVWEPELGVTVGSSGVQVVVEVRVAGTLRLAAFVGASSCLSMLLWSSFRGRHKEGSSACALPRLLLSSYVARPSAAGLPGCFCLR